MLSSKRQAGGKSHQEMDCYEFGRKLITSLDLDPVYVVVWNSDLSEDETCYWLLPYFCFYHVGTASWIAQHDKAKKEKAYWDAFIRAAGSKEWHRASERRHFRGEKAVKAVQALREIGVPSLFEPLLHNDLVLKDVMEYVQTWPQFGKWISFKVADMMERLGLLKIDYLTVAPLLFDSPREACHLLYEIEHPSGWAGGRSGVEEWALNRILHELEWEEPITTGSGKTRHLSFQKKLMAPPRFERPIGPAEVETVLCKWGSYCKSGYWIGKDIDETRHSLLKYANCRMSQRLYKGGKKGGLW